jgi:hypothetical protein
MKQNHGGLFFVFSPLHHGGRGAGGEGGEPRSTWLLNVFPEWSIPSVISLRETAGRADGGVLPV